jgi:hypothetical protein
MSLTGPLQILFFILFVFFSLVCNSQKPNKSFSVNIGLQTSVGPTVESEIKSEIQNLYVQYFPYKRYRNPALRIRINNTYNISEIFGLGIESGLTVHYSEKYYDGIYRTTIAIPVMLKISVGKQLKEKARVDISFLGGYNYLNIDQFPYRDKGGFIYDIELGYKFNSKTHISTGYELQVDNDSYTHVPANPGPGNTQETLKYQQKRRQIYLSFGLIF